jgi:hypothetical protein
MGGRWYISEYVTFKTTFLPASPVQEQVPVRVPVPAPVEQAAVLRRAEQAAVPAAVSSHSRPEQRSRRIPGQIRVQKFFSSTLTSFRKGIDYWKNKICPS